MMLACDGQFSAGTILEISTASTVAQDFQPSDEFQGFEKRGD